MAGWYPVMLNMEGKRCLVCGGGKVAGRKVGGLLEAGAQVRVVSPELSGELRALVAGGRLSWLQREARPEDSADADYVFAATDDAQANRRIAAAARSAGVPVNLADDGEAGDFLLPAVVRRGRFVLTASTSGSGPALAVRVARELADRYGPEYEVYTEWLGKIRAIVKSEAVDAAERRKLLHAASEEAVLRQGLIEDLSEDPPRLMECLRREAGFLHDGEEPL